MRNRNHETKKAEPFEGMDILYYLEREIDDIVDDELTKGRIRSIYVKIRYGQSTPSDLAEYYDLPIHVIRDIASGKLFKSVTRDLREE